MKKRLVSAIIYGTTALCLFWWFDFLYAPPTSRGAYIFLATAGLFAISCALSFFTLRLASIFALFPSAIAWALLWRPAYGCASNLSWQVSYQPWIPVSVFSLIVTSIYAVRRLTLSRRSGGDVVESGASWWKLSAAFIYATTMLVTANWQSIWEWLYRLRYGR